MPHFEKIEIIIKKDYFNHILFTGNYDKNILPPAIYKNSLLDFNVLNTINRTDKH